MNNEASSASVAAGWYPDPTRRHQARYWSGTSWTDHVADNGFQSVDSLVSAIQIEAVSQGQAAAVRKVDPAPYPVAAPERRQASPFLRRILWNIYALPATALFVAGSLSLMAAGERFSLVDLIASLPLYLVTHLHIWEVRSLKGWLWKAYAFAFVAWQLTYSLVLGPMVSSDPVDPTSTLVGFAIQLPMLVAMFRYAFRAWPERTDPGIGSATSPKRLRPSLAILLAAVGGLGFIALAMNAWIYLSQEDVSLARLLPPRPAYEVSVQPQGVTPATAEGLPRAEAVRLRRLFENGQFDRLDASLASLQRSLERNPRAEVRTSDAFKLFTLPGDERQLDAWVSHSPSHFAPYMARAEHRSAMGWKARGGGWAKDTSVSQIERMESWFVSASRDVDAAIARNPKLLNAHVLRLRMAMAQGQGDVEAKAFAEARRRLPHSFILYRTEVMAQRPRWGGSYEEMERLGQEAVSGNPGDGRFYALFGAIYEDQADLLEREGRFSQAASLYSKALTYGETRDLYDARAGVYLEMGKPRLALKDAERCLALDPYSTDSLLRRATVYLNLDDTERAVKDVLAAEKAPMRDDERIRGWKSWAEEAFGLSLP